MDKNIYILVKEVNDKKIYKTFIKYNNNEKELTHLYSLIKHSNFQDNFLLELDISTYYNELGIENVINEIKEDNKFIKINKFDKIYKNPFDFYETLHFNQDTILNLLKNYFYNNQIENYFRN